MVQDTVWLMTVAGVTLVTVVYLFVFLRSGRPDDAVAVKARLYRIRPWWFAALVALIVVALATTLARLPYADTHDPSLREGSLVVEALGNQWYWRLSHTEVPAGTPIAFEVQAGDVNHSFAIYDDQDRLLVQAQAMPGYTNVVRHVFERPGTYTIRCLEYCGVGHHVMTATLAVTAATSSQGESR